MFLILCKVTKFKMIMFQYVIVSGGLDLADVDFEISISF
jgi:hypothetical protein